VIGLDVGTLQACVAVSGSKSVDPLVVENHEVKKWSHWQMTSMKGFVPCFLNQILGSSFRLTGAKEHPKFPVL